jgi:hypothetical protein
MPKRERSPSMCETPRAGHVKTLAEWELQHTLEASKLLKMAMDKLWSVRDRVLVPQGCKRNISEETFKRNRDAIETGGELAAQLSKIVEYLIYEKHYERQSQLQFGKFIPIPPNKR